MYPTVEKILKDGGLVNAADPASIPPQSVKYKIFTTQHPFSEQ